MTNHTTEPRESPQEPGDHELDRMFDLMMADATTAELEAQTDLFEAMVEARQRRPSRRRAA